MLEIADENGDPIQYVTATEAPEHFGKWTKVTTAMVNKWHQRRKITGYRVGQRVYFRLDELKAVEFVTRTEVRGRKRSSD